MNWLDPKGSSVGDRWSKRILDVLLSGVGLIFAIPIGAIIGLAIKLDDGGPIFYSQARVGRDGRSFESWKFRSMIPDSDERFGPLQARTNDFRVTRVGQVLRATALDELPQLWNIFRGDMSFVGPRALLREETETNGDGQPVPLEKIPGYEVRQRVRPGLTGIAQIYAPRDIPRRHKFKFDRVYVRRQSLQLDMRLISISVLITLSGRWGRQRLRGTQRSSKSGRHVST